MGKWEDLSAGITFITVGTLFLLTRRKLIEHAIVSGDNFWGLLGVQPSSERLQKIQRVLGLVIFTFAGFALVVGGLLSLYEFFMGQKLVQ